MTTHGSGWSAPCLFLGTLNGIMGAIFTAAGRREAQASGTDADGELAALEAIILWRPRRQSRGCP